jgi:hypothetical protein
LMYDSEYPSTEAGLCWYDGTNVGIIPASPGGIPQWGGLPNSNIRELEYKAVASGYELWMSCKGRGIAVLTVTNTVVPVELVSFAAKINGNSVTLNWSTSTETNNSGFSIERKQVFGQQSSVGNEEWIELVFVEGKGTTTEINAYSYSDNNLTSGKYLYRLKQIDFDGTFTYSNDVEVIINFPEKFELSQNYPNPFNPSTSIKYQIAVSSPVSIKIYDVLGNEVATLLNGVKPAGNYEVTFDASSLSSGTYFYRLQAGSFVETKKMLLIK